jgi:hypothetical protein
MSLVRLWVAFDTRNLTPAQTREAFIQAVRDAVTTAQSQGRVDRTIADQLRHALTHYEPQA